MKNVRFTPQIVFEKFGKENQEKLAGSVVVIVGCGATGSRSAELLVRAGIGKLILIDRDIIEESNLQRQTLYTEKDLDKSKVFVLKEKLEEINSEVKIFTFFNDLNYKNIKTLIKGDLILDCTDNLESRFLINDYALKNDIPWIYSAVLGSIGIVYNVLPGKACFRCFTDEPSESLDTCDTEGILNTTVASISSMQVTEAMKILTKQASIKEMITFDIWKGKLSKVKVVKNDDCLSCNGNYEYLDGKSKSVVKLCGANAYQLDGVKLKLGEVARKLENLDKVFLNEYCLKFKELTMFADGRVLVKADNEEEAKNLYAKYIGN